MYNIDWTIMLPRHMTCTPKSHNIRQPKLLTKVRPCILHMYKLWMFCGGLKFLMACLLLHRIVLEMFAGCTLALLLLNPLWMWLAIKLVKADYIGVYIQDLCDWTLVEHKLPTPPTTS